MRASIQNGHERRDAFIWIVFASCGQGLSPPLEGTGRHDRDQENAFRQGFFIGAEDAAAAFEIW